jgi:hypothetical protein
MRALITDAYVAGGWSERDAGMIAMIKVDRMIAQEPDGDIEGFEPLDDWGGLCEGSNGIAVVIDHFVEHYAWDFEAASKTIWSIYSSLSGWNLPDPNQSTPPIRETCPAYSVTYQFCRNGITTTRTVWWSAQCYHNTQCYYNNFVNNPCVGAPFGCNCPAMQICGIEYIPVGNCGGATPGECIRVIRATFAEEIQCSSIVGEGGCADCSAPPPLDPDCPTPILAACYPKSDGPCGGCEQPAPAGN